MRRNFSTRKAVARLALLVGLVLGAGPALASPAELDPSFGFDGDTLGGLPWFPIGAEDPFLDVGEQGMGGPYDVEVTGSTNVCILFGDDVCRSTTAGIDGPYSVIMTLTVAQVNTSDIYMGPFTLFLSGLANMVYPTDEVVVELNPVVPTSLDTMAVPGFVWNDAFTPFTRIEDRTFAPGTIYDYIGWIVNVGDSVTFRYDVLAAPDGRTVPQLMANATPIIPEPGTAVLMGLGLAGLAAAGGRRESRAG